MNQIPQMGKVIFTPTVTSPVSEQKVGIEEAAILQQYPTQPLLISNQMKSELEQAKVLGLKPWMVEFQKALPPLPIDPLSNARPDKAVTTHLIWNVTPDFETKKLCATAHYFYTNKEEGNPELILDVAHLNIKKITVNGAETEYYIIKSEIKKKPDGLHIPIPVQKGGGEVKIEYETTKDTTALYWVDPQGTHGKKHGLLYTLFQENEGASAIPGQHSPQIRLTYEVNVLTLDDDLMALSSVSNNPRELRNGEYHDLKMSRAVPLYLLSLHVGNFEFKPYDERTGVYTEPKVMAEFYKAFENLPEMLKTAERICGPYQWGTYTPIFLSWAFPYFAMEHPCASTCGAICLEHPSVIAHELAHSWSGNDITNAIWQQFFWNEGLVTYLEYKISKEIWGENYASMQMLYTLQEMDEAIEKFKKEGKEDLLRLCQQSNDLIFTRIPYAKGALFFFMLEEALGEDPFNNLLKDYMKIFYQNSMSDERFLEFLKKWISYEANIQDPEAFLKEHQVHEWLYGTEIPSNSPKFQSSLVAEFEVELEKLLKFETLDEEKVRKWNIVTQGHLLSSFFGKVSAEHLTFLDMQFGFTQSPIMTIREEWARLCAKANHLSLEIKQMIADYLIERNSLHKANQISAILNETPEGIKTLQFILYEEKGRLFSLTREAIIKNLNKS